MTAVRASRSIAVSIAARLLGVVLLPSLVPVDQAWAQAHGISVEIICEPLLIVGGALGCTMPVQHGDTYGDTWEIQEAWAILDPGGLDIRVPAQGNLAFELVGASNGVATDPDNPESLPFLIGPQTSQLSGLPGLLDPGQLRFTIDPVVTSDLPNLLTVLTFVVARDVCDHPVTESCAAVSIPHVAAGVVTVVPPPEIQLVVTPVCACFDGMADVEFLIEVTNPGVLALGDVEVHSDASGRLILDHGDDGNDAVLDPGETWWYLDSTTYMAGEPHAAAFTATALDTVFANEVNDELVLPDVCDCNQNDTCDELDVLSGTSEDCDGDLVPDECEIDCNTNGLVDDCEIADGAVEDCDENGVPDECDVQILDCNGNGTPDPCDVASGASTDCDGNGVPDECEIDCNDNGIPDSCEVLTGLGVDCDGNGILDECEPFAGAAHWINAAGGAFSDCLNWDPGTPSPANAAVFDVRDATYVVAFGGAAQTQSAVVRSGDVTFALGACEADPETACYRLISITSPSLVVGETTGDAATLRIRDGAVEGFRARIGSDADAFGDLFVTGPNASLGLEENLCIGCGGDGYLEIADGATVVCRDAVVGDLADSSGAVVVTGAESTWLVPFLILVDNGSIRVDAGATITAGTDFFGGIFLFEDAELSGDGTIEGAVVNFGDLLPADGGTLTIDGNYAQIGQLPDFSTTSGRMTFAIGRGPDPGRLLVTGEVALAGALVVNLGDEIVDDRPYTLLESAFPWEGQFEVLFATGVPAGRVLLPVEPAPAGPGGGQTLRVHLVQLESLLGFEDPLTSEVAGAASDAVVADLDGDGDVDVAVALHEADRVEILLNDGTGTTFEQFPSVGIELDATASLVAAPLLSSGGPLDLAVTVTGPGGPAVAILAYPYTDPEPGWQSLPLADEPTDITAGEFDENGRVDLAVTTVPADPSSVGHVEVLLNQGDSVFTPLDEPIAVGHSPIALRAGRFSTAEGAEDLLVVNGGDDTAQLLRNSGMMDGLFDPQTAVAVAESTSDVDPADVDEDNLDALVIGSDELSVVRNGGAGNLLASVDLPLGDDVAHALSLATGDLDGDGDVDVAVIVQDAFGERSVKILRNDSLADQVIFTESPDLGEFDFGEDPLLIRAGDLDGDGTTDLITIGAPAGSPGVMAMAGPVCVAPFSVILTQLCGCLADADCDGTVGETDLELLFEDWGSGTGPADVNGDGIVNVNDLIEIIVSWGDCS